MATETPGLDTRARQSPEAAHQPHPSLGDTTIAWVQLAGATAVAHRVPAFAYLWVPLAWASGWCRWP